jgi:hypothetical protein
MNTNLTALRPEALAEAIAIHCLGGNSVFVSGPPGIGKSDVMRQIAINAGMDLIDWRLSQRQQVDLLGLPDFAKHENGTRVVTWVPPTEMVIDKPTILFLDELPHASHSTQAAAFQLIQEKALGGAKLDPEMVWVVAAGNRRQDMAVIQEMSKPLQNRFVHLELQVNHESWSEWAARSQLRPDVLMFIRHKPDALFDFDPKSKDHAFATPRTWEKLANAMDALEARNMSTALREELELPLAASCVGHQHAIEYVGAKRMLAELPDFDDIIADPKGTAVPTLPEIQYVAASGLAHRAKKENFDAVYTYLMRLPPEFMMLAVKLATNRDETLKKTGAYIKGFAVDYKRYLAA